MLQRHGQWLQRHACRVLRLPVAAMRRQQLWQQLWQPPHLLLQRLLVNKSLLFKLLLNVRTHAHAQKSHRLLLLHVSLGNGNVHAPELSRMQLLLQVFLNLLLPLPLPLLYYP